VQREPSEIAFNGAHKYTLISRLLTVINNFRLVFMGYVGWKRFDIEGGDGIHGILTW
jgi:2-oxoglutarate dehydrogenase complex dehydrogenase (E1) component-like enzyme